MLEAITDRIPLSVNVSLMLTTTEMFEPFLKKKSLQFFKLKGLSSIWFSAPPMQKFEPIYGRFEGNPSFFRKKSMIVLSGVKKLYFSMSELRDWVKKGKVKTRSEIEDDASNYIVKRKRTDSIAAGEITTVNYY
jgi:hypothetical protein